MQHLASSPKTRFWAVIGLVIFAFIHAPAPGGAQPSPDGSEKIDMTVPDGIAAPDSPKKIDMTVPDGIAAPDSPKKIDMTVPDGIAAKLKQALGVGPAVAKWEKTRTISPAGLGTKSKLAVGWLFYPERLDSVVGLYAYPVGPTPLCYGSGVQGYERGATAIVLKSTDEDRYTSGQVWEAPSPTQKRSLSFEVAEGSLCVATKGLDCQAPAADQAASCLFLAEHAIKGATPTAKFWIDLGTNTFYMGRVEASLLAK